QVFLGLGVEPLGGGRGWCCGGGGCRVIGRLIGEGRQRYQSKAADESQGDKKLHGTPAYVRLPYVGQVGGEPGANGRTGYHAGRNREIYPSCIQTPHNGVIGAGASIYEAILRGVQYDQGYLSPGADVRERRDRPMAFGSLVGAVAAG